VLGKRGKQKAGKAGARCWVLGAGEEQKPEWKTQNVNHMGEKGSTGRGAGPRQVGAGGACLAPCEDAEWSLLLRWENLTDRGVERKMRQYFRMRRRYRRTTGEEIKRKN